MRKPEARPKPTVDEAMPEYPEDKKEFFEMVRMMNDMCRLALQTDSTRVITLFLGSVRTPGVTFDDGRTLVATIIFLITVKMK